MGKQSSKARRKWMQYMVKNPDGVNALLAWKMQMEDGADKVNGKKCP